MLQILCHPYYRECIMHFCYYIHDIVNAKRIAFTIFNYSDSDLVGAIKNIQLVQQLKCQLESPINTVHKIHVN